VVLLIAIPVVGVVALGRVAPSSDRPLSGGVLGLTASPPTAIAHSNSGPPSAGTSPAGGRASEPAPTASNAVGEARSAQQPRITVGDGVALSWSGPYGERRIQVIVPVHNDGAEWLALPQSTSTYRVEDAKGREVASGVFTAALPAAVAPHETGYLVDTVSAAFVAWRGRAVVDATVKAVALRPPSSTLHVTDLAVSTAPDGGLRVSGQIHNDGTTASGWVVAGAVVLDGAARPLGAVYDPGRIGRMEAGSSQPFDTTYPGAPAPPASKATTLVGVAFEALDDSTG
jgi:hypothetical protein